MQKGTPQAPLVAAWLPGSSESVIHDNLALTCPIFPPLFALDFEGKCVPEKLPSAVRDALDKDRVAALKGHQVANGLHRISAQDHLELAGLAY
jgi:hypothetical protein